MNLDPAAERYNYTPVADIRDLIQLEVSIHHLLRREIVFLIKLVSKVYNNIFLFVGLTTLGTLIE